MTESTAGKGRYQMCRLYKIKVREMMHIPAMVSAGKCLPHSHQSAMAVSGIEMIPKNDTQTGVAVIRAPAYDIKYVTPDLGTSQHRD